MTSQNADGSKEAREKKERPPKFSEDDVKQSLTYKFHVNALEYPPFDDNVMYCKLRGRLLMFFIQQERVKALGKTDQIRKEEEKSGYSWEYRIELHNCLKRLLIRVTGTRDPNLQREYLRDAYFWFMQKLMSMGILSYKEQLEENKVMNPQMDMMSNALREIISQKVTSALTSDE